MEYVLECRYHVSNCECCLRKYAKRLFSILMSLFIILPVVLSVSPISYADDGLGDVVSSAIGGAGVGAAVGGAVAGASGVTVGAAIGACVGGCAQATADIIDAVHSWEKNNKNSGGRKAGNVGSRRK